MKLFDIFSQRPLDEKPSDPASCPGCGSDAVVCTGRETTTVGGVSPLNHVWDSHECRSCGLAFCREHKGDNVWYTTHGVGARVLKGVPTCFEPYFYSCAKCDGTVRRTYEGKTSGFTVINNRRKTRNYRIFYRCDDCDHGGEVNVEYHGAAEYTYGDTSAVDESDAPRTIDATWDPDFVAPLIFVTTDAVDELVDSTEEK